LKQHKLIALFFATQKECELIFDNLTNKQFFSIKNLPFIKGKINGRDLILSISGIGKTSATLATVICFENFSIKLAIVSGIAGAYPSSMLDIGKIAVAEKEIFADEGLLRNCHDTQDSFIFLSSEEIPLYVPDFLKNLPRGTFLTVSACTGNIKRARFLEKKFNALCENMEGASVAKVSQIFKIPCVEIRSISNIVTDREKLLNLEEISKTSFTVQRFILDHFLLFEEFL
jgi:futalosine hydrolase